MPQISNNVIKIYHKDIRKDFTIKIMYNQKYKFYAVVPREFFEVVHHLSDDKMKEFNIRKNYEKKYSHSVSDKYDPVVDGFSEGECLTRMKAVLEFCVDKSIEQRKVIILFYNPKDTVNYNEHRYNKEHPQIGMQMGLTYAIETCVGDKKIYSTYNEYTAFGETRVERHELNLWGKASTIIDDTPANRKFLEHLYIAMKKLNDKLKDFTSTPDKLLELIGSNQKLLN